jgi:putative SOS response-associated peptidase YedK
MVDLDVYSFLATVPNALTASINHERSPVLLTSEADMDSWLSDDRSAAEALIRPIPAERLRIVQ